jgi:hypothetical protein
MQMSPHEIEAADNSSADRLYDLSLRILMVVVSVGLVASVAFLTYRWLAPPRPVQSEVPVVEIGVKPSQTTTPAATPAPKGEVLMNPGQIFKCEVNGRITFSEQPCSVTPVETKKAPSVEAKKAAPVETKKK